VALEYQVGKGRGGAYLIILSFFVNNSSDQAVESRVAEWLCYLLVVRCVLLIVGPPMGLACIHVPHLSVFF
jgi:hypothetical protein